jgi:hypothetical protein
MMEWADGMHLGVYGFSKDVFKNQVQQIDSAIMPFWRRDRETWRV